MQRYRFETNNLIEDRRKHNEIYKQLLFEFQSNVPQQKQQVQVQGTFAGKYDMLCKQNQVKQSVTTDIKADLVNQTKKYLATNQFAKAVSPLDVMTYNY